jgi:molybdopterin-synthase adenylyltransferase
MIELHLQDSHIALMREQMLGGVEGCAVLFTHEHKSRSRTRVLGWSLEFPDARHFIRQGRYEAELSPEFVASATQKARQTGSGIVFVHSHPFTDIAQFSAVDDAGEAHLSSFLKRRLPGPTHLALLLANSAFAARVLGTDASVRIISHGNKRCVISEPDASQEDLGPRYDRQVRAFGRSGQNVIGDLRVGIVGLGGTGSIVAQELAHLGVRHFTLVDPDLVDESNLNRLAGAGKRDIGQPKVNVARRYIASVAMKHSMRTLQADVVRKSVAEKLLDLDFIFGCTDSHASRAVLNQIAYQYFIPTIDMGSTLVAADGHLTHIHGRVQILSPGLACLQCSGLLDANRVRQEMMTEVERATDPYFVGAHEPAPAVMSLNGTVSSLAVTMFLDAVLDIGSPARHLLYDAMTPRLRVISVHPRSNCYVCSKSGFLGTADSSELLVRQD